MTIGLLLFVAGCYLAPPDVGAGGLPSGEYTLTVSHDNATNKRICACPICHKRMTAGVAPLTDTRATLLIDGDQILAVTDAEGNPVFLPDYSLQVTTAEVRLVLNDEFNALPAGTYVLTAQDDGRYGVDADQDLTASDGRAISVTLTRS